ncbi:MAG: AEC family transporter [Cyclobacteriaceae bacterium]
MYAIFEAILPIFLLVMLGLVFSRWQFPAPGFWKVADRITYYVFLPALLVEKLVNTSFTLNDFYSLTSILMLIVIGISIFLVLIRKLLPVSPASFTSVFQGSIRPNNYVVLAAAIALFGPKGLALAAIAMAGVIPLVNVLCIACLNYYVSGNGKGIGGLIKGVLSNPIVLACIVGIFLNVTGIGLPYVSNDLFKILSSAALPMGLISVGTGLQLKGNREQMLPVIVASLLKLIVLPLLTYYVMTTMGVEDIRRSIAVLFSSVPCAISSYILAGHLNGDQKLMATIITFETMVAFVTMPILLALLG